MWRLFSIDASKEDGIVGRLINDSKYFPNARVRKIVSASRRPYLCLFAVRDIDISKEILYFYDEENLQWHEQVSEINWDVLHHVCEFFRMDFEAFFTQHKIVCFYLLIQKYFAHTILLRFELTLWWYFCDQLRRVYES